MPLKTDVENRLFFPHNALNKALAMNVSFLPQSRFVLVKTGGFMAKATQANVKTEERTAAQYRQDAAWHRERHNNVVATALEARATELESDRK